jgi:hypothetical protein
MSIDDESCGSGMPLKVTVVLTVSARALRLQHQADQRLTEAVDD